jgi:hypothetical protein
MPEIRGRGRKGDQKMKPYLVYEYLMRNSDENHVVSASEVGGYLEEFGISAERRSIYKDIEEIIPTIQSIIKKYTEISKNTCIVCGKAATHMTAGYIVPLCDSCEDKF